MGLRSRQRTVDYGDTFPNTYDWYSYSVYGGAPYHRKWPGLMIDMGQSECTDQTNPGPPYRTGGPFSVIRYFVDYNGSAFDSLCSYGSEERYHHWGTAYPPDGVFATLMSCGPSLAEMDSWADPSPYGATGWNKFKPGKPGASLSVFLGELRDVPRMFQFKLRRFKDIGSQYLNYQFGWKPFLNDLRKFLQTTNSLQKRYNFLRRNNGRWLRRGGTVQKSVTTGDHTAPALNLPLTSYQFPPGETPSGHIEWTEDDHIWFEAAMKFWVPEFETPNLLPSIRQMYGLNLSPSVVWELVPWSWLADWFANIGDVMSNLSDTDAAPNLVAKYAYIMRHRKRTAKYDGSSTYYALRDLKSGSGSSATAFAHASVVWESEQRLPASPFGFGFTWDDLSLRQLAILAALGVTRLT